MKQQQQQQQQEKQEQEQEQLLQEEQQNKKTIIMMRHNITIYNRNIYNRNHYHHHHHHYRHYYYRRRLRDNYCSHHHNQRRQKRQRHHLYYNNLISFSLIIIIINIIITDISSSSTSTSSSSCFIMAAAAEAAATATASAVAVPISGGDGAGAGAGAGNDDDDDEEEEETTTTTIMIDNSSKSCSSNSCSSSSSSSNGGCGSGSNSCIISNNDNDHNDHKNNDHNNDHHQEEAEEEDSEDSASITEASSSLSSTTATTTTTTSTSTTTTITIDDDIINEINEMNENCNLWIAKSTIPNSGIGLFAGRNYNSNDNILLLGGSVGKGEEDPSSSYSNDDVIIPLIDLTNNNHHFEKYTPFEKYTWESNQFGIGLGYLSESITPNDIIAPGDVQIFSPGIGSIPNCILDLVNIQQQPNIHHTLEEEVDDDDDINDNTNNNNKLLLCEGRGGYSDYTSSSTTNYIIANPNGVLIGQELFIDYGDQYFIWQFSSTTQNNNNIPLKYDRMDGIHLFDKFINKLLVSHSSSSSSSSSQINNNINNKLKLELWQIFVENNQWKSTSRILSIFEYPLLLQVQEEVEEIEEIEGIVNVDVDVDVVDDDFSSSFSSDDDDHQDNNQEEVEEEEGENQEPPTLPTTTTKTKTTTTKFSIPYKTMIERNQFHTRSIEDLKSNGICGDHLYKSRSTIEQAGYGAFAKRFLKQGSIVGPVPLLHITNHTVLEMMYDHPSYYYHDDNDNDNDNNNNINNNNIKLAAYDASTSTRKRRRTKRSSKVRGGGRLSATTTTTHRQQQERNKQQNRRSKQQQKQKQYQLLLNYCMGHKQSSLLLCPYGPMVSLINHSSSSSSSSSSSPSTKRAEGNVKLQWSLPSRSNHHPELLDYPLDELEEYTHGSVLAMELIATRDIFEGEEILLDYGMDWQLAWESHVEHLQQQTMNNRTTSTATSSGRVHHKGNEEEQQQQQQQQFCHSHQISHPSAQTFRYQNRNVRLKTKRELESDPYPPNIQLVFDVVFTDPNDWKPILMMDDPQKSKLAMQNHKMGFFVPVEIIKYKKFKTPAMTEVGYLYTAVIPSNGLDRKIPQLIKEAPREAFEFLDKPYSTDQFLPWAFRHPIGIPDELFPDAWKNLQ